MPVTVPQSDGGLPGKGSVGKFQQVTRLRIKKNPPTAKINTIPQKMNCPKESGPSFVFLREVSLFIQV
jgi:hypothetical protein